MGKSMKVSLSAWLDPRFWRFGVWFWCNSLVPGYQEYNHQSHRLLALYSLQCQEAEEDELKDRVACNKTAQGTLKLFHDKKEMEEFLQSEQAQFWSDHGYPFTPLSIEQCPKLEPSIDPLQSGLVGGVKCNVDSSGEIHMYTTRLKSVAKEAGVKVMCGTKVDSFMMEDNTVLGVHLTSGESLQADITVLAAGVYSSHLAANIGVNIPVYPLKGHMATVRLREGRLGWNVYSPKHGLASPVGGGMVRIAGMVEAVGWDHTVEEEKGRKVMEKMRDAFLPGLMEEEEAVFHSCLRPVCADDVALIGRSRRENLWVNTGHGSKGWTYSWGAARLLADMVMGEDLGVKDAEERFSPLRFHPIRRFLKIL